MEPIHYNKADEFICKLIECVEKSAAEVLLIPKPPRKPNSKSNPFSGWNHPFMIDTKFGPLQAGHLIPNYTR